MQDVWSLEQLFRRRCLDYAALALQYQEVLTGRHALNFADLILMVRAMLKNYPDVRDRWMNRFDLVQVDEVQDTHLSEYEVVRYLALRTGNLAFVGDTNQTIYEWRGSHPWEPLRAFQRDFNPVAEMSLRVNYRATHVLVKAANSVADHLSRYVAEAHDSTASGRKLAASSSVRDPRAGHARHTAGCLPSVSAQKGEKICVRCFEDSDSEAQWISREI